MAFVSDRCVAPYESRPGPGELGIGQQYQRLHDSATRLTWDGRCRSVEKIHINTIATRRCAAR